MIVVGGIEKNGRWEISKSSNKCGDFPEYKLVRKGSSRLCSIKKSRMTRFAKCGIFK